MVGIPIGNPYLGKHSLVVFVFFYNIIGKVMKWDFQIYKYILCAFIITGSVALFYFVKHWFLILVIVFSLLPYSEVKMHRHSSYMIANAGIAVLIFSAVQVLVPTVVDPAEVLIALCNSQFFVCSFLVFVYLLTYNRVIEARMRITSH